MRIPKVQRTPTSDQKDETYWEMFSKLCSSHGPGRGSREEKEEKEEKDVDQRVLSLVIVAESLGLEHHCWSPGSQYVPGLTDDHMLD